MRYTVTIPLPPWTSWPRIDWVTRLQGQVEARKLGVTLPDDEPRIVSGIGTMRYAKWEWDE